MANYLYRGDLPAGLDLGPVVAVDCETMGLVPGRDRLCLVQLSAGDGDAHLVQILPGVAAPNLARAARRPGAAEALPLRPVRHRRAAQPPRRADRAGLLHQDRLAAGPDLHRPARAQGPGARAPRHRHLEAAAVERLGRRHAQRRRSSTMPPPTCSTCTGSATSSTPGWRARAGPSWRRPASTSCRPGRGSTSPAGRRSTSSRTAEARPRFDEDESLPKSAPCPELHACGAGGAEMPAAAAPDPDQLIATGRRVVGIEADGLARLAAALGPSFAAAVRADARRPRPGDRLRHGQVRPRRPQDRRDPRLDRHARRSSSTRPRRATATSA